MGSPMFMVYVFCNDDDGGGGGRGISQTKKKHMTLVATPPFKFTVQNIIVFKLKFVKYFQYV